MLKQDYGYVLRWHSFVKNTDSGASLLGLDRVRIPPPQYLGLSFLSYKNEGKSTGLLGRYIFLCHDYIVSRCRGSEGKDSAWNAGDLGSFSGLGRFPWRRAWHLTAAFLPGESPWTEEPGGLRSTGLQSRTTEWLSTGMWCLVVVSSAS